MNLPTVIVLAAVAVIFVTIIAIQIRRCKKGGCSCGGDCGSCGGACNMN